MLDQIFAVDEASLLQDDHLFEFGLSGEELLGLRAAGAMAHEDLSALAAGFQRVRLRQRDEGLDDASEFLAAMQGGVNVAMTNELPRQVLQQGSSLVARQSEFASINSMVHGSSLVEIFVVVVQQVNRSISGLGWLDRQPMLAEFVAHFVE